MNEYRFAMGDDKDAVELRFSVHAASEEEAVRLANEIMRHGEADVPLPGGGLCGVVYTFRDFTASDIVCVDEVDGKEATA
jgi:hypothetical protein